MVSMTVEAASSLGVGLVARSGPVVGCRGGVSVGASLGSEEVNP